MSDPVTVLGGRPAGRWPEALLLDLDGVVYTDETPMPGAIETVAAAHRHGCAVRYITNNAFRTPEQVADRLQRLGISAVAAEVVTSSSVATAVLTARRDAGLVPGRVAVVGGPGLSGPLSRAGFDVVDAVEARLVGGGPVDALVQGFSPDLRWVDLAAATRLVRSGVFWLATNLDLTLPTDDGPAPGNGSMVRAVATAADRGPDEVAGKPAPAMFLRAAVDAGDPAAADILVVGDRLDTDIAGAVAAGLPAMLVLTGVHGVRDAVAARRSARPALLGATLADVVAGHPPTVVTAPGHARCRDTTASVVLGPDATVVTCAVTTANSTAQAPVVAPLDAARALLGASWSALDAVADDAVRERAASALARHPMVTALDGQARRHASH